MKRFILNIGFVLTSLLVTSCYTEVIVDDVDVVDPGPTITLREVLSSYELWYVDIDRTVGNGYIPFVQKAFTMSFRNGTLFANNNLVGIGDQGNGFGIDVGFFDTYGFELDVTHDLDGSYRFEVIQRNKNEIELYYRPLNLSYILVGYQRSTFDYNALFYDNIHYFLQEYVAWEKTYTSPYGDLNQFDNENYLQFLPGGGDGNFRSSEDPVGVPFDDILWDYTGIYNVDDVPGNRYLKNLTLDYDLEGNEYFELSVINDSRIELFHTPSGTLYEFTGRGYVQYKRKDVLRESKATIEKQMIKIEKAI